MDSFRIVRREMNRRLARAQREGRLSEVMAEIERNGRRIYREIMGDTKPGRPRSSRVKTVTRPRTKRTAKSPNRAKS